MAHDRQGSAIEFHPQAAERLVGLSQTILGKVTSFGPEVSQPPRQTQIHPVAHISEKDIVGELKWREHSFNGYGEETGRFWNAGGHRVGWEGSDFEELKNLAKKFESLQPIKGKVSFAFLLDEVFQWLREQLEKGRTDNICEYIARRCTEEIHDYEIWVPIFQTYSSREFRIGPVIFRTITKDFLEPFYSRAEQAALEKSGVAHHINRERSSIQGSLAACITVHAEARKASEVARFWAAEATGLLRFVSTVNWTAKLTSHCLPHGLAKKTQALELIVSDGELKEVHESVTAAPPHAWNLDEALAILQSTIGCADLLQRIHRLASEREQNEFNSALYDSMILYSRASAEAELSNRIVFVLAALESLLLKDANEPIQSNLGERLAFLTATEAAERRDVFHTVKEFYGLRSRFIHHGKEIGRDETEIVDKFLFSAWFCFVRLIMRMDEFHSRGDLFNMLEGMKFS